MRAARILSSLTVAALAIGTVSLPTAAAAKVRWVDDDGKAGPAGCGGRQVARPTIQGAVNAADAGDTIIVCPGEYAESVVIGAAKDRLTIRALPQWGARVLGGEGTGGEGSSLLKIKDGARGVTVQGLVFSWDAQIRNAAGFGQCTLDAAITVLGQDATILANRVRATGATYSPCGYLTGIQVGSSVRTGPGGASTPASADVSHNAVRDFFSAGITAIGPGVTATIQRNSVRYWHLDALPQTAASRTLGERAVRAWTRGTPAGLGALAAGIALGLGATGTIYGNEVSSGPDATNLLAGRIRTPALFYGITVAGTSELTIRGNTVRRTVTGYSLLGVTDSQVRGNASIDHSTGIILSAGPGGTSTGNRVGGNQVGPGLVGIGIAGSLNAGPVAQNEDNTVVNNTVFGHLDIDCYDHTTGSGTAGTANTWASNSGVGSNPLGLCQSPL